MKIHILFPFVDGPYGGGNQFLKNLKKEFQKKKIYEEEIKNADVVIFNSFQNLLKVIFFKLKYPNKIWIHRVDGPISKYRGKDFHIDKIIYEINNKIADGTIFQSLWSQKANHELGMKKKDFEIVIKNSCSQEVFNDKNKDLFRDDRKIRLITSSWSSNWNKGFEFYKFLDDNLDFSKYEMTFVGNSPVKFKKIHMLAPLESRELVRQLKKHDIYITASKNDPCSNSLLEAMSCGLPAVCLKSGGHSEIMGSAGELFTSKEELIKKINLVSFHYNSYHTKIQIEKFSSVAEKYISFVEKLKSMTNKTNIRMLSNLTVNKITHYFLDSYRRKAIDDLLIENRDIFQGVVLDIGGRDRGIFLKPKNIVKKWIFADIEKKHNPDVVLDVANMKKIQSGAIDIILATELFEHVEKIDSGLKECYRVLQKNGKMIISVPFMFPVHADPFDFQRWTETKWRKVLKMIGFSVDFFCVTGLFFTVLGNMFKQLLTKLPFGIRHLLYFFLPILDLIVAIDRTNFVKNNNTLNKYHDGYFMILSK